MTLVSTRDSAHPRPPARLAALIDHTLLKPDATRAEVARYCAEALTHGFASVCVNPVHVAFVARSLTGSGVHTCAVTGFPLGASGAEAKADEARRVVAAGADEIDMVIDIGAVIEGDIERCRTDLAAVRAATDGKILKVIIEACLLDTAGKTLACLLSRDAGADFVKTSTGFAASGATVADIALMWEVVGPEMGVKASGGVRTTEAAWALIDASATRIGASASLAIIGVTPPAASTAYCPPSEPTRPGGAGSRFT